MTIPEFVEELARAVKEKPGELTLKNQLRIRSVDGRCPICWLGQVTGRNPNNGFLTAQPTAIVLGLSDADRIRIEEAADVWDQKYDRELRRQLLTACGLNEENQ